MHSDHQRTGLTTMNAVWPTSRDYLAFIDLYEAGILPWNTPEVWLFSFGRNLNKLNTDMVTVDITGSLFDLKYQALLEHKSQYDDAEAVKRSLKKIGAFVSKNNGGFEDQLLEAFEKILIL